MSHAFRVFLITSMLAAIASAQAAEATPSPSRDGIRENGLSVNDLRKNGIQLNGMSLNRLAFNGTQVQAQLSGMPLDRVGIR